MADEVDTDLLGLTARIVVAHVEHNEVSAEALPGMITSIYRALATTMSPEPAPVETRLPAVAIRRSVFPDYIVCLEDGKKLKMLKRHLQASYGMTPNDYREKWALPPDYPMVAPNYSAVRSGLAKDIGLGRKPSDEGAT